MTSALDLDTAARTVYGEARGSGYDGMKAVAHVIWNRLRLGRWGDSLTSVCMAPKQFSCQLASDVNKAKLDAATYDNQSLRLALKAVLDARDEPDPTLGATHYFSGAETPAWAKGRLPVNTIGGQFFLNNVP